MSEIPPIENLQAGFALAVQLLRNREDAADAVQDSVHRFIRKRGAFDSRRGSVRAWFLKIVRNRCIDQLRRDSNRTTEAVELHEPASRREERPDVVVEQQELQQRLREELMTLSEEHREILLLRDFHDLGYAEIADVLAVAQGTVMSRLHRAREELRRRMQKYR